MTTVKRVPHCSHWGAYTLLVEDGRITGVEPFASDPAPSPIIQSVRYWADPARRVAEPMVRETWLRTRGPSARSAHDRFVPVSFDDAFRLIAEEIDRVRTKHGNASIFAGSYGWTSCGRFHHAPSQLKRMLNLAGGYTGHVDTYSVAAGPVILRHVLGGDGSAWGEATSLDSIAEHAETLLVFGALSPRTAQNEAGGIARHMLEDHLRRLRARGARIVLISPVRDDVPDWVDAEWWPIRPNTDTALMLALAGEIVVSGRHDRAFLGRCCSGSDVFLAYLEGARDGQVKDAAWAEAITGIEAPRIRELAGRIVASRTFSTVSWSLQRADHGEQPYWAALGLAAVAGQIGLPGGGVGYGYGSLGGVGAAVAVARSPSLPQGRKPNPDFIPVARIADLLLHPGEPFTYAGATRHYPDTRLVYWAGGNPFHHHQDLNRLRRAWARPETVIVQDPMWTATARRADIVLPASTSIERNDIAGNRRCDHLVAMQQAIAPVGQARSDYDIFRGIADALGVEAAFSEGRDEMDWIRHLYENTREDARRRHQHLLPDFDTFWREGAVPVPVRGSHTYLEDFRANPAARPLRTESGRIVLGSRTLAELGLDDCPAHPAWIEPAEWLGAERAQGGARLHLLSSQPSGKLHSQLDDAPLSQATKRGGREQARLHAEDASRLGIADGQTVRLWNERGQCLATATVVDTVRPGVVVLPTGSWYDPEDDTDGALDRSGNPNVLTLDKGSSRFGQGCAAHTCLVAIEPYEPAG
ncbi:molybdopterin-dependent oxidoreductase [Marinivivus vitaminiproducens]|uniref:molybdopterin-dependent oxidoreductase n=1 Tax=Marinivivus vitaminiproducens TaxID=3035935 RepID=UPI0027A9FB90|nr:molybdopterin-dependent oxidoreductase [Geminicoccaceae bacterium SCSIO 64248]